jgi:hypothetical protein
MKSDQGFNRYQSGGGSFEAFKIPRLGTTQ